jgi:toxin ParE1/3/4
VGEAEGEADPTALGRGESVSRQVRIAPLADRDVDGHFARIAAGGGIDAASRFHDRLYEIFQLIAWMPGAGRLYGFRRKRLASLRCWPVKGYRDFLIFYRERRGGIEVVRVLHGARDIKAVFEDDA